MLGDLNKCRDVLMDTFDWLACIAVHQCARLCEERFSWVYKHRTGGHHSCGSQCQMQTDCEYHSGCVTLWITDPHGLLPS